MSIYSLIALTLFPNQYACMHKLDMEVVNRPKDATFMYIDRTSLFINLYEASAVIKCENNIYTAHVVESGKLSDFNLQF